jgi:Flp pilus assembly protein CpaB
MATAAPDRATGEAPPARQRHRSVLNLVSGGHLVMIVAGLLGMLLTLALLRSADHRVRVAVAAHDLLPGDRVGPDDLRYERVKMDDDLLATVLEPDDVDAIAGSVAIGPVDEGELVARRDLRRPAAGSGLRAVSIPIDPSRAVAGDLSAGDRADVIMAGDREVAIIIAGAEVLAVNGPDDGTFGQAEDELAITLAVNAEEAQLLAAAVTDGDILVARSTGSSSAKDTPPLPIETIERP